MSFNTQKIRKSLQTVHEKLSGEAKWKKVRDEEFAHNEAVNAADFDDMLANFNYPNEDLLDFLQEQKIQDNVGARLVIAEQLPIDLLGAMLFQEKDRRIISIIKKRCLEARRLADGRNSIILPGEDSC